MRRRAFLAAAPALLLEACRPKTPAGQPPLSTLSVEAFRDAFNRDSGMTRVLALLSPT